LRTPQAVFTRSPGHEIEPGTFAKLNLETFAFDALYYLAVTYGAKRDALMRNRQAYIKRVLAQAGDAEPSYDAPCAICPQPD